MSEKTKTRIETLEQRKNSKDSIVVAWEGPIELKPGQTVIGSGYPFKKTETKKTEE